MNRLFTPLLLTAAFATLPAVAQTQPGQGWPANRPPDQAAPPARPPQPAPPQAGQPQTGQTPPAGAQAGAPGAAGPPIPLPGWFVEIDTAKKGEVSRADFLKYRMKSFEELDANKDNKLSVDEFLKLAEPPYSSDVPNGPTVEERKARARTEFQNLDTNRDGFIERAEAEALVHAEFNQYDTDRDNKVTEPEVRLLVQRSLAREQAERQQAEAARRQGKATINDFIDMQLREADRLDKNNDGKVSQQEYISLAGPADGPQTKGLLPYDLRRKLVLEKFAEVDSNRDGNLDRVELTAAAVKQFFDIDINKDRFLTEDEFKAAQERETKRMQAKIQTMMPAQQQQQRPPGPAPAAQPQRGPQGPAPAPAGLPQGLPQGTR